jgi:hypothetical protein
LGNIAAQSGATKPGEINTAPGFWVVLPLQMSALHAGCVLIPTFTRGQGYF